LKRVKTQHLKKRIMNLWTHTRRTLKLKCDFWNSVFTSNFTFVQPTMHKPVTQPAIVHQMYLKDLFVFSLLCACSLWHAGGGGVRNLSICTFGLIWIYHEFTFNHVMCCTLSLQS
jgi:hypothetical protein